MDTNTTHPAQLAGAEILRCCESMHQQMKRIGIICDPAKINKVIQEFDRLRPQLEAMLARAEQWPGTLQVTGNCDVLEAMLRAVREWRVSAADPCPTDLLNRILPLAKYDTEIAERRGREAGLRDLASQLHAEAYNGSCDDDWRDTMLDCRDKALVSAGLSPGPTREEVAKGARFLPAAPPVEADPSPAAELDTTRCWFRLETLEGWTNGVHFQDGRAFGLKECILICRDEAMDDGETSPHELYQRACDQIESELMRRLLRNGSGAARRIAKLTAEIEDIAQARP